MVEETLAIRGPMSSRTRLIVMSISAPVIAFAIVGGFLGKVMAREDTYQHLKIFDDVVSLISSNYVEEVEHRQGDARRDARAGRRPRSGQRVSRRPTGQAGREPATPLPPGDVGLELTRQYYLRVIAARDGSPAAKAGLRTGDYIRAIDDMPTREMSVWEGMRALRGAPGTKVSLTVIRGNAADPHVVELTREALPAVRRHRPHRRARRRLPAHRRRSARSTADQVEVADRRPDQGRRDEADRRRAPHLERHRSTTASRWRGCSSARARWRCAKRKGDARETIAAAAGDGAITLPTRAPRRHRHVGRARSSSRRRSSATSAPI